MVLELAVVLPVILLAALVTFLELGPTSGFGGGSPCCAVWIFGATLMAPKLRSPMDRNWIALF